jgi:glycosyltransferase involved in cell wall biosynthesis
MLKNKKIALVHYWLTGMRGGEKLVQSICNIFPDIDIFTLVYDKKKISDAINNHKITTSFIQKLPLARKKYQNYLPFMPVAIEQFDLSDYDLVISSESGIAKGVLTRPETCHICYCHSPMRYLWNMYFDYMKNEKMGSLKRNFIKWYFNYLRVWDLASAARVDYFISNSHNVRKRIKKYYRRDAEVIYPPVNIESFKPAGNKKDYYLIVSQLVSYKRIDLAVEAFNELGLELIIIGEGPELKKLKKKAKPNIKFVGWMDNSGLALYYAEARAFIFPGEEDFGITPVEAQASGTPVIGYGRGGLCETVVDGKTGILFKSQDSESLVDAVKDFESSNISFNYEMIQQNSSRFSIKEFEERFRDFAEKKYWEHSDAF